MEILKPIEDLIFSLACQIADTPITTKEFNDVYNEIVCLFDHHLPQIKDVVFAQQSYDLVERFKIIEVAFEEHKEKKEEEEKQQQKKKKKLNGNNYSSSK
ncbi:unnamed protein product [Rotaria sordida]|uniref:Uncharacterized protein n=3 Tax=Rotaria sordida TaxID=392033 RepID=A0A815SRH2_9BILA|nr:unnamed protein product [Rotaria sordida]